MKNLFYKELKLAIHPVVWVMVLFFPLMILIPSYPAYISFIYVCSSYPILFLGANKGQTSNDIYFTSLLPVKKSDVIKARMITVVFLQFVSIALLLILNPVGSYLLEAARASATPAQLEELIDIGFSHKAVSGTISFSIISFAIYDFIYFTSFYKNGRSIVLPTLLGILTFTIIESVLCLVLPLSIPALNTLFETNIFLIVLAPVIAILISALIHFLAFQISKNRFEKVDL